MDHFLDDASYNIIISLNVAVSFGYFTPQLDLAAGGPAGDENFLSGFPLITNPSASSGNLGIPGPPYLDPIIYHQYDGDYNPVNFTGADLIALPAIAAVYVVSDGFGTVMYWGEFVDEFFYYTTADSLLVTIANVCKFD